jgi:hypothetical protein
MKLIFKDLSPEMDVRVIHGILTKGLLANMRYVPFVRKSSIKQIKVIQLKDPDSGSREYHALVKLASRKDSEAIINYVNGKSWKGNLLTVERFHIRYPVRDRRDLTRDHRVLAKDKRVRDRRRARLRELTLEQI